MPGLSDRLQEDLKAAMRAQDVLRRETLRYLQAAVRNAAIEKRAPLSDEEILVIIQRQIKQRRESITAYRDGRREDLAAKEEAEIGVLEAYLPVQMSRDAIAAAARAVITRVGARGASDKGKVMGPLMAEVRGKADGALVSAVVAELLTG